MRSSVRDSPVGVLFIQNMQFTTDLAWLAIVTVLFIVSPVNEITPLGIPTPRKSVFLLELHVLKIEGGWQGRSVERTSLLLLVCCNGSLKIADAN